MEMRDTTVDERRFEDGTPVDGPEDDEAIATEQEQMDYEMLVVRAEKIIFGSGKDNVLRMLGAGETPAKALGQAGAMILKTLVSAAKEAGREISPASALEAGTDVIYDLNELAKANGVFKYDDPESEQQELEDAMLWGVKAYGDGMIQSGEITPEMRQEAKAQVEQGLASEGAMQKTPIAEGVGQAMAQPGLVGGAMGGMS